VFKLEIFLWNQFANQNLHTILKDIADKPEMALRQDCPENIESGVNKVVEKFTADSTVATNEETKDEFYSRKQEMVEKVARDLINLYCTPAIKELLENVKKQSKDIINSSKEASTVKEEIKKFTKHITEISEQPKFEDKIFIDARTEDKKAEKEAKRYNTLRIWSADDKKNMLFREISRKMENVSDLYPTPTLKPNILNEFESQKKEITEKIISDMKLALADKYIKFIDEGEKKLEDEKNKILGELEDDSDEDSDEDESGSSDSDEDSDEDGSEKS
jgi:predicted SpoU family rRNA methylase